MLFGTRPWYGAGCCIPYGTPPGHGAGTAQEPLPWPSRTPCWPLTVPARAWLGNSKGTWESGRDGPAAGNVAWACPGTKRTLPPACLCITHEQRGARVCSRLTSALATWPRNAHQRGCSAYVLPLDKMQCFVANSAALAAHKCFALQNKRCLVPSATRCQHNVQVVPVSACTAGSAAPASAGTDALPLPAGTWFLRRFLDRPSACAPASLAVRFPAAPRERTDLRTGAAVTAGAAPPA